MAINTRRNANYRLYSNLFNLFSYSEAEHDTKNMFALNASVCVVRACAFSANPSGYHVIKNIA